MKRLMDNPDIEIVGNKNGILINEKHEQSIKG